MTADVFPVCTRVQTTAANMADAGAIIGAIVGVGLGLTLIYNLYWSILLVREKVRSLERAGLGSQSAFLRACVLHRIQVSVWLGTLPELIVARLSFQSALVPS
jgi:hypothetical protein